ncbi:valine--tRNA ligase [candidate division WOR-3 bacterium]|nr:valine--tRNA ligase [candidate division WOR-3 bacterium]
MHTRKNYDPFETEKKWSEIWKKEKTHEFDFSSSKPIYSVDTPPPTVSGSLHMGHIFSYTHTDFQVRFFRMNGFNVYYPMGFDDNGLPSEILTEKSLNIKAEDLPRDEFVKKCHRTCSEFEVLYENLWKKMALSVDWNETYTTIDDKTRRISQRSFLELLKSGRIYYGEEPVMWCRKCGTAISQAEIEEKNFQSKFNDIAFKVEGMNDLEISTTRPELLPSCVAVFVHPQDVRYKGYVGKRGVVPVFGQKIEIMSDAAVDMEKGTGAVMCCTFGDRQDIEWWKNKGLELRISIDEKGRMNNLAGKFKGMEIDQARESILEEVQKNGCLLSRRDVVHLVNTHERCSTPIEFLSKKQWFLRVMDIKEELIRRADEINWYPKFMKNRYVDWVQNLAWDWCLSRQRFFGVPIPIWRCSECGEVILPDYSDLPVDPIVTNPPVEKCPRCSSSEIIPETDVMDTWATSSLTPQINAKWREEDERKGFLPMDLRPQAHDIIRTWTFYTIVKSHLHNNSIPWKNIVISGFVTIPSQDSLNVNVKGGKKTFKSEKLSKSKHGDIASPEKLLEKYGADVIRFWAAGASPGMDFQLKNMEEIDYGKKVATKIWNAFKFMSLHLKGYKPGFPENLEVMDEFILMKLSEAIEKSTEFFNSYDFRMARNTVLDFFWRDFCDYYLEIVKDRLYNPQTRGENATNSAKWTVYNVGKNVLLLFAPFMPYLTEEISSLLFCPENDWKSIHLASWPVGILLKDNEKVLETGQMFFELLGQVREYRGAKGMSQKEDIEKASIVSNQKNIENFKRVQDDFSAVSRIKNIELKAEESVQGAKMMNVIL